MFSCSLFSVFCLTPFSITCTASTQNFFYTQYVCIALFAYQHNQFSNRLAGVAEPRRPAAADGWPFGGQRRLLGGPNAAWPLRQCPSRPPYRSSCLKICWDCPYYAFTLTNQVLDLHECGFAHTV